MTQDNAPRMYYQSFSVGGTKVEDVCSIISYGFPTAEYGTSHTIEALNTASNVVNLVQSIVEAYAIFKSVNEEININDAVEPGNGAPLVNDDNAVEPGDDDDLLHRNFRAMVFVNQARSVKVATGVSLMLALLTVSLGAAAASMTIEAEHKYATMALSGRCNPRSFADYGNGLYWCSKDVPCHFTTQLRCVISYNDTNVDPAPPLPYDPYMIYIVKDSGVMYSDHVFVAQSFKRVISNFVRTCADQDMLDTCGIRPHSGVIEDTHYRVLTEINVTGGHYYDSGEFTCWPQLLLAGSPHRVAITIPGTPCGQLSQNVLDLRLESFVTELVESIPLFVGVANDW